MRLLSLGQEFRMSEIQEIYFFRKESPNGRRKLMRQGRVSDNRSQPKRIGMLSFGHRARGTEKQVWGNEDFHWTC